MRTYYANTTDLFQGKPGPITGSKWQQDETLVYRNWLTNVGKLLYLRKNTHMDNLEETKEQENIPQLIITEDIRSYLYDMAKWANFLAIVGFVIAGFMIIASFTVGAAMSTNPELASLMASSALSPIGFTIFCLIYSFAIFYPSLLLFKYATRAKIGVLYGEQASLNEAFSKLKSLFKYWGIITIVFIVLYILMVLFQLTNLAPR